MEQHAYMEDFFRGMAELRKSQEKTDEQLNKLSKAQEKTDAQLSKLEKSQEKTDEQMKETDRRMKETDTQIKELKSKQDKSLEETKNLKQLIGNMGTNNGDFAEEFFFRSLEEHPVLGGIGYDRIERRIRKYKNGTEYDIVMINGDSVAIIEVKYKANHNETKEFVRTKINYFRNNFREFDGHKLYFGIATLITNDKLERSAREEGVYLLTQKGNHMEVVNDEVKTF